jgi:hypothetical protein
VIRFKQERFYASAKIHNIDEGTLGITGMHIGYIQSDKVVVFFLGK